ncbi:MAG: chromosome segregation protein SMC, partial [Clostridia bacterium]|nr:chromosome segregation protein SMC [Clostridia bacterium]
YFDIEGQKNKLLAEIEKFAKEKEEATNKIKQYEEEINSISYDIRMKDSRYKFLVETEKEKEGYTKSVKSLLLDCDKNSSLKSGVEGVLANLISVDSKYQTAIEMALGGVLQNIVTDNEQTAKKLVEHLRQNNLGRASFLPVSSVKGNKIERLKCNFDGYIGIASDLVKCDKRYGQIVSNLLGRTVVVDNMDTGIQVAKANNYAFRIVTLKGDIISNSGAITGGSVATKTVNILGRSNEIESLEKEIKSLKSKLDQVTANKEKYEKSISGVIEKSEELDNKLNEINIVYATEKQKMLSVEESIDRLTARLEKLKQENENIKGAKAQILKDKEEKFAEIEKIEKENNELNAVIEQFALLNKDNQKIIDDLNFDITNLRISVSSFDESGTSIDEMVERIELDITNNNSSIENKEKQISEIAVENTELENNIVNFNSEIEKIKSEVTNSTEKVEELKASRVDNNKKLEKTETEITDQFTVIEGLKEQLVKIDVKKTKFDQDLKQVVDSLWEEYEMTPNNCENYEKPSNVQATQKQVNKLRNKIRDLGSINIDSIEEYKKAKERYDFMSEQRLDLENTQTKLRGIIADMTKTMKVQFAEKFAQINKNFNEVFQELFGGGKAELVLEDEDNILECGIDIRVQPTGKKLQNMMLLSGGEKAFTAIALLFAILKINPAPFCILDEIEAALDDVNVYRYADYLKKFSDETQFLVITHRKGTMEAADTVYGVTMEENGISKLLSIKMA